MQFLVFYRLSEAGQKNALRTGTPAGREQQLRIDVVDQSLADRLLELATIGFDGIPRVFFGEPSGTEGGIVVQKFHQRPIEPVYAYYAGGPLRRTLTRIPALRDNEWSEWEFDASPTVEELVAFANQKRDAYLLAVARFKRREARKRNRWGGHEPDVSGLVNDMIRSFLENPSSRAQWDHKGRPFLAAPNRDGIWSGWIARFNADVRFIREANRRRLIDRERFRREREQRWRSDEMASEAANRKFAEWTVADAGSAEPIVLTESVLRSLLEADAPRPDPVEEEPEDDHRRDVRNLLDRFRTVLSKGAPRLRLNHWKSSEKPEPPEHENRDPKTE